MTSRTYVRSSGTFFTAGDSAAGAHTQVMPPVVMRQTSTETTTVGVHVRGILKVEAGKAANSVSVMLDTAALRRKMAIEQMQREIQGLPSAKTTKR